MYIKARLKLNIKRLYAADGKAVRELLKLADLLYTASLCAKADPEVRQSSIDERSACS
jgi:clusterin-associated protein 1